MILIRIRDKCLAAVKTIKVLLVFVLSVWIDEVRLHPALKETDFVTAVMMFAYQFDVGTLVFIVPETRNPNLQKFRIVVVYNPFIHDPPPRNEDVQKSFMDFLKDKAQCSCYDRLVIICNYTVYI